MFPILAMVHAKLLKKTLPRRDSGLQLRLRAHTIDERLAACGWPGLKLGESFKSMEKCFKCAAARSGNSRKKMLKTLCSHLNYTRQANNTPGSGVSTV